MLLASTYDPLEAAIWRQALEEEGIPVWVRQDDPLGPLGVHHLTPRYDLYVLASHLAQGRLILALSRQE